MRYKSPSIIEIYTVISLGHNTFAQEAFFDIIPILKRHGFTDIKLGESSEISVNTAEKQIIEKKSPRVHCFNADKTKLIQLSEDVVTINLIGQYLGWDALREVFDLTLHSFDEAEIALSIRALRLQVIDQFEIPKDGYTMGRFLNCGGTMIPGWYNENKDDCDISLGKGFTNKSGYNRVLNIKVRHKTDSIEVRMETGLENRVTATESTTIILEDLHNESNHIFEDLITDETRATILGGGINE